MDDGFDLVVIGAGTAARLGTVVAEEVVWNEDNQHASLVGTPAQHNVLPQAPLLAQGLLQGLEITALDDTYRIGGNDLVTSFPRE